MIAASDAVKQVGGWAELHRDGVLCDPELANSFLCVVLEAEFEAAAPCLAALPASTRPVLRGMLADLAARDWYDDRHRYIGDDRTHEQRQAHCRAMQSHFRRVGVWLLGKLGEAKPAEPFYGLFRQ